MEMVQAYKEFYEYVLANRTPNPKQPNAFVCTINPEDWKEHMEAMKTLFIPVESLPAFEAGQIGAIDHTTLFAKND